MKSVIVTGKELGQEFPKYTREENLSCKLSDEQIEECRNLRKEGLSYKAIGQKFNVTDSAVFYWCLSPEERERRAKQRRERQKLSGYKYDGSLSHKKYRERKMKLKPEYATYEKQFTNAVKKKRPNYVETSKKTNKKMWEKNGARYIKEREPYREKNRDLHRFYMMFYNEAKRHAKT